MIEEMGTVIDTHGKFAVVGTDRKNTCGGCSSKGSCGTGAVSEYLGARYSKVRVLNGIDAKCGEQVIVGVPEKILTVVSFRFYIIPLLLLILGAIAGEKISIYFDLSLVEPLSIFGGLLGLVIGTVWLKRFSKATSGDQDYQPIILRRANTVDFVN